MRPFMWLVLGCIGWVMYSVATSKPSASRAGSLDALFDDDADADTEPRPGDLAGEGPERRAFDKNTPIHSSRSHQGNGSKLHRAEAPRRRVRWCVRVPETTPTTATIYVTGNHPDLGNWSPLGLPLHVDGPCLYCGELELPAGTVLEYKFTRGTWEAVETWRGGIPRPNRALAVRGPELVHAEVEAWSDRT